MKKKKNKKVLKYPLFGYGYHGSDSSNSETSFEGGDGGGMGESEEFDLVKMIREEVLKEMPREFVSKMLTFDKLPKQLLDNYYKNITIGVAFVKKDGSLRYMGFRKKLNAYVRSTEQKTEAQSNILQNNNLLQVYDANLYIKAIKGGKDGNNAARASFRRITLDNVIAFVTGNVMFDARNINKILERYGEDVYDSLTKNMKEAIVMEIKSIDDALEDTRN